MNKKIAITSWVLMCVAVCAWGGVVLGSQLIVRIAQERAADMKDALTKANQEALNQKVRALAATTEKDRASLESLLKTELVYMINTIEAAGATARVQSKVSDASLSGTQPIPQSDPIRSVVFSVQAQGTYTQIMHAAKLYETLPLLSSVEQVELERVQSAEQKTPLWNMLVRIRVQTTSSS
jgi:hypothetical protein